MKSEGSDWIYPDKSVVLKHKYFGIKGWAFLLAFSLVLPLILNLIVLTIPMGSFESMPIIDVFIGALRALQNWFVWIYWVGGNLVLFYMLIKHKSNFQVAFLLFTTISIVFYLYIIFNNVSYAINLDAVAFDGRKFRQLFFEPIKSLIVNFGWILYVLKSKRINLVTKGRVKKKHL